MSKKLSLETLLTKSQDNAQETVIIESVVETVIPEINYDAILTEWSYRCESGYPTIGKKSDMIHLQEILKEMGIENPFPKVKLTEAPTQIAAKKKKDTFTAADVNAAIVRMKDVIDNSGISKTASEQMADLLKKMTPAEVQTIATEFQTNTVDEFFADGWKTFKKFWTIKGDKVGTGRGELMAVMAIEGAASGGTGMKDLQLSNGKQWEVKEDPYSIRMAKSGFSGLFEYVDEMRTFYKYLINLNLNDVSKDKQLESNLKAAFNNDALAMKMLTILKKNFRGDGFKATKADLDDPNYVDTETFFERVKIAAELPASVIQLHYKAFTELKELRKDLIKNPDLIKTAKMTVKTTDTENDYYISKNDAEELRTAKVDAEVSIHKGKPASNKDFRVFMFNFLKIFDHTYTKSPGQLVKGFNNQKDEYFGEVEGVLYYFKGNEEPHKGFTSDFVVFGISQGQGKLSLRDKYDNRGYTWIDMQK